MNGTHVNPLRRQLAAGIDLRREPGCQPLGSNPGARPGGMQENLRGLSGAGRDYKTTGRLCLERWLDHPPGVPCSAGSRISAWRGCLS
jgi:hypothetical protein